MPTPFDPSLFLDDTPVTETGLRPWQVRILDPAAFVALGPARLGYLAHLALLAPTSHNTVPQRFQIHGDALRIWLDRRFVLPESDRVGRQAVVSVGCAVANAVLGARSLGWRAETRLLTTDLAATLPARDDEARFTPIVDVIPVPGDGPEEPSLLAAIPERRMVRAEFDERERLPPDLSDALHARVAAHPGLALHLMTDAPSLLFLGKFQEMADTTVFNRDTFARELGEWFLPNDSPSPLGMRGREFGLDDDMALHMHRGLLREERLLPDEVAGMARGGKLGMRTASAVAVITVEEDTLAQRLAAGQAFQELALLLVSRGFVTSMHAGITEVEPASLALRGRLRTRHRPTVVFRLGRVLRPEDGRRVHAARPPLDAVWMD